MLLAFQLNFDLENEENKTREDILLNFCYSIIDFFDNKKYNMDRLKPIDFSDMIKSSKESQSNSLYKRLSALDKKEYLKKLSEMKMQQNELKNERINQILAEGRRIYLIKIKSDLSSIPKLNFLCNFKDEEIFNTKKCLLNNWILPPPEFYEKYYAMNNINSDDDHSNNLENKEKEKEKEKELGIFYLFFL